MNEKPILKRIHFVVPIEMYNRMAASGIFKELDSVMYDYVESYLEKMGY